MRHQAAACRYVVPGAASRPRTSSAGSGGDDRSPCSTLHPWRACKCNCDGVSTPPETTVMPSPWASAVALRTIAASSLSIQRCSRSSSPNRQRCATPSGSRDCCKTSGSALASPWTISPPATRPCRCSAAFRSPSGRSTRASSKTSPTTGTDDVADVPVGGGLKQGRQQERGAERQRRCAPRK